MLKNRGFCHFEEETYVNLVIHKKIHIFMRRKLCINMWIVWITCYRMPVNLNNHVIFPAEKLLSQKIFPDFYDISGSHGDEKVAF